MVIRPFGLYRTKPRNWLGDLLKRLWRWLLGLITLGVVLTAIATSVEPGVIAQWEGVMYVSQNSITLAWDPSEGATYYEVRLEWIDQDPPLILNLGQTTDTQMVIAKPKVGHYVLSVRSCNDAGCSEWSKSDDPTKVQDGKPFRVYFRLVPSSGLEVN